MADKTGDAIALWQQMLGEMQKGFGAFAEQALAAQGPRGSAAQAAANPGAAQKQLADLVENYFIGMNLPSRTQVDGMAERLQALELQVSEVKALLLQMQTSAKPQQPRPAQSRTRRPDPAEPKREFGTASSKRERSP
jgi:hypothetical protein